MTSTVSFRERLFFALEEHEATGIFPNIDDFLVTSSSVGIILITAVKTYPLGQNYVTTINVLTWLFATILAFEFVLRLWAIGILPNFRGLTGKLRFIFRYDILDEWIAVIHAVLLASGAISHPYSLLNLLFIVHFVKISRYITTLREGFAAIQKALKVMMPLFVILVPLLLFNSYLFYLAESEAQPDKFNDLGNALWFAIVTASTVGYGDMSPVTGFGKIAAFLHMTLTIGLWGSLGAQIAIQVERRLGNGIKKEEGSTEELEDFYENFVMEYEE